MASFGSHGHALLEACMVVVAGCGCWLQLCEERRFF